MRYVSTRGEAPPVNFVDATLAGLARDGGLYVPEAWPKLSAATIASFKDMPYAEVALEVVEAADSHVDVADHEWRPRLAGHGEAAGDRARHLGEVGALHGCRVA